MIFISICSISNVFGYSSISRLTRDPCPLGLDRVLDRTSSSTTIASPIWRPKSRPVVNKKRKTLNIMPFIKRNVNNMNIHYFNDNIAIAYNECRSYEASISLTPYEKSKLYYNTLKNAENASSLYLLKLLIKLSATYGRFIGLTVGDPNPINWRN